MKGLLNSESWLAGRIESQGPIPGESEAGDVLVSPKKGDLDLRVGAYVNGYPARIREALSESFPAIEHIAGHSEFTDLARRYLPACPTGTYSLGDVGVNLAAFLASDPLTVSVPFLPDLARLEWCIAQAFHARLLPSFDPASLSGLSEDELAKGRLKFQSGVSLVRSMWPLDDLRRAPDTPREELDIDLNDRPQNVVVYRRAYRVPVETLGDDEAALLEILLNHGHTLGDAAAWMEDRGGFEERFVVASFARWARAGWIAAVVI